MEYIRTDSKDPRTRVHLRMKSTEGATIVAYGDVDDLPEDSADQISHLLDEHPLERYPEGAYIGTIAPPGLESNHIRSPDTILSNLYPREIELTSFPPTEDVLYKW